MKNEPLVVCVTGAAGQIAYSFIPQLCTGLCFPAQELHIRLLDITAALNTLKGVILELTDCSYPLVKSVIVSRFRLAMEINRRNNSEMLTSLFFWEGFLVNQVWRGRIYCKSIKKYLLSRLKPYPTLKKM